MDHDFATWDEWFDQYWDTVELMEPWHYCQVVLGQPAGTKSASDLYDSFVAEVDETAVGECVAEPECTDAWLAEHWDCLRCWHAAQLTRLSQSEKLDDETREAAATLAAALRAE